MREPYPRPRAEATLGVPAHFHSVVAEIAKRLRLKPGWPAQITSGLTFQDREGGNYVVSLDDAGWHVALGWHGAAATATAFRRAIEKAGGVCDTCGDPMQGPLPEGWRCRHCHRDCGDGGLEEDQR
jgi:hypothetical protein